MRNFYFRPIIYLLCREEQNYKLPLHKLNLLKLFKVEEEVKNMTEEILKQNGHSVDQEDNGNLSVVTIN